MYKNNLSTAFKLRVADKTFNNEEVSLPQKYMNISLIEMYIK